MTRIDDYRFGRVVVDGEEQTRDVIVLPERVLSDWWRADGHRLVLSDLDEVIEELPERLLVGTGAYGRLRPDPGALEELASALNLPGPPLRSWIAPASRSSQERGEGAADRRGRGSLR